MSSSENEDFESADEGEEEKLHSTACKIRDKEPEEAELDTTGVDETLAAGKVAETKPKRGGPMKLGTRIPKESFEEKEDLVQEKNVSEFATKQPRKELNVEPELTSHREKLLFASDDGQATQTCGLDEKTKLDTESEVQPEFSSVLDKLSLTTDSKQDEKQSWGWSNWGTSLISTASSSVSVFTSHVSQGLNTVLETVEAGVGAPPPETLAKKDLEQKEAAQEAEETPVDEQDGTKSSEKSSGFSLGHLMRAVEGTGSKVIAGGLDTLELIGRKTMDVLQEGDPHLRRKRALLRGQGDRPDLSAILREAKEASEKEAKLQEEEERLGRKPNFGRFFDEYHGLVHLEALEMLSKECETKRESHLLTLSGIPLQEALQKTGAIQDLCEVEEVEDGASHDFSQVISELTEKIRIGSTPQKILQVQKDVAIRLQELQQVKADDDGREEEKKEDLEDLERLAIDSLAQLTAAAVEYYHRTGELLLVQEKKEPVTWSEALNSLTVTICTEIGILSSGYSLVLSLRGPEDSSSLVTNVFLEASNSSTYVQEAFQLMTPILQWASLVSD